MHNYISQLHILRSNLKRYILLFLTLITSSVVMGQEITIPIKTVTADPIKVKEGDPHLANGHQSHEISNIKDGNTETTWIADQFREIKILNFLQLRNVDNTDNGMRNFIEVPYIPNENTEIEVVYESLTEDTSYGMTEYIFGSGDVYSPGLSYGLLRKQESSVDHKYLLCLNGSRNAYDVNSYTGKHTLIFTPQSYKLDNAESVSLSSGNLNGAQNLCFFFNPYVNWTGSRCFPGKIYSVKIREKGKLVYDLLPAANKSNTGFYDRISTKFFSFNIDYIENINNTNSAKDNVHVKIPLTSDAAQNTVWSKSLVQNGYFQSNELGSSFRLSNVDTSNSGVINATGTDGVANGARVLKVVCPSKGDKNNAYDRQLLIDLSEPLYAGDDYYVSFYYKADKNVTIQNEAHNQANGYIAHNVLGNINFTDEWQLFEKNGRITNSQSTDAKPFNRITLDLNVLNEENSYYITNVVIKKQVPTISAASAGKRWSENLVNNGTLETDDVGGFEVNRCTMDVDGNVLVVNKEEHSGQNNWYSQMFIKLDEPVLPGEKVYISFDYRSGNAANVYTQAQYKGVAKDAVLGTTLNFKTQWQPYSNTISISNDGLDRIGFNINEYKNENTYYLRNVVIRKETTLDPGKKWSDNLYDSYDNNGTNAPITNNNGTIEVKNDLTDGSGNAWAKQFRIKASEPLVNNEKYYISFSYSASGNANVNTWLQGAGNYQSNNIQLQFEQDTWKTQVWEGRIGTAPRGEALADGQNVQYLTFHINELKASNTYRFRDIVIRKQVDADPAPTEPALDEGMQWSKSLVQNGNLSTDNLNSFKKNTNGSPEITTINGVKAMHVKSSASHTNPWDTQFFIVLDEKLQPNDKYYISFDYRTADGVTASVGNQVHSTPGNYNANFKEDISFTQEWQNKTWTETVTDDQGKNGGLGAIAFNLNGRDNTDYYFTNIIVKKQIPINEEDKPVSELTIKFENLNTNKGESYSVRHLFSLGTHEEEIMALTTRLGKYNYVSGGVTKESILDIDQNIHTATFKAGECKIDNTTYTVGGVPSWNSADALYLMGTHCDPVTNHNGYAPRSFYGRIYSATMTENGFKKLDLIPTVNENGDYGFYDKVSGNIYVQDECAGTSADGKLGGPSISDEYGGGAQVVQTKMPFKIDFETDLYNASNLVFTTANRESGEENINANNPKEWVLYASNDGILWEKLEITESPNLDTNGQQYEIPITNNKEAFTKYRLNVESVITPNDNPKFSRLRIAQLGLSAKYSFEHYVGRVYDDMGVQPDNLSGYNTEYKTNDDDSRLATNTKIQRTHEYEHVVYALPGETVNLTPFSDFDAIIGNETSWSLSYNYRELYIRWYDYVNDTRSNRLTFDARNGHTVNELDKGHFAWNRGGYNNYRTREGSVAKYTAPESSTNGVFDVIALEAANTFDWTKGQVADDGTYVIKEPTLQWRHTFVIKDARERTNQIYDDNQYIKNNKITLMCPAGTPFQYPLPSFEYAKSGNDHPTDYYTRSGTPSNYTYTHVQHYLIETTKNSNSQKNSTFLTFDGNNAVVNYTNSGLDSKETAYSFKEKDGYNRVFYMLNPQVGTYTIKIYALKSDNSAGIQLMEYELQVLPPEKGNQLVPRTTLLDTNSNGYTYPYQNQIPAEMERLYGKPTTYVNFDNIKDSEVESVAIADLHKPVLKDDNQQEFHYFKWPWQWENSSYGFGYEDRGDYNMYMVADHMAVTPNRGIDRGNDTVDDLKSSDVFDVSYYESGKKGYFFYANAASDPSRMAVLNIGQDFCPNTKVYVSAWINEVQHKDKYAETANVIFSFRGVKDGVETVLNSYVTGYVSGGWNTPSGYIAKINDNNLPHLDATNNPDYRGQWMHVYYTFSTTHTEEYDYYIITLENNCTSSEGADYAIDDIRAYVLKPNLQARLMDPVCDNTTGTKIEIYGNFEQLKDAFFPEETGAVEESLKYCFLDKDIFDNTNTFDEALITGVYGSEQPYYGVLKFNSSFSNNLDYKESWYTPGSDFSNYYKGHKPDVGDIIIFPCDATDVKINPGKSYILAIATLESNFDVAGKCSRTSVFKIPNPADIKIDGTLQTSEGGVSACANQRPEVTIDMNGVSMGGTPVTAEVLKFDWYYGPISLGDDSDVNSPISQGYTRSYADEKLDNSNSLHSILSKFRELNATADDGKILGVIEGNSNGITTDTDLTNEKLLYIKSLVQEGRLTLYKDKAFATAHLFGENLDPAKQKYFYMTALPINPEQQVKDKNPEINSVNFCLGPIGVSIKINELTPTMMDGDGQVTYPNELHDVPLRIGLKQLKRTVISDLADNSTKEKQLWLPLRAIAPVREDGQAEGTTLKKNADDLIYLVDSNDPDAMKVGSGAIISQEILKDKDNNTIDENLNITNKVVVIGKLMGITAVKTGSENVCQISFLNTFKFREGYWYTMKFHFSQQDASDQVCPGDLIFTIKVVPEYQMWTGAKSRNWNDDRNWRRVTKEDLLWKLNDADVKSSDFLTANADYISDGETNDRTFSYAPADFTKVIIPADVERVPFMYDMRSSSTTSLTYIGAPSGGLQITNGDPTDETIIGKPTENVIYDMASIDRSDNDVATRPWYDHTCDQIHFNAGAILMDQRYLYYNKAWCDIDVPVGTWQTVASPLMNIVAGDLYLPTATARQQTPLFEDITYQTDLNDRFKPAVFQRSWNKSMAKVYKLDGNMDNVGVTLDWSHVYNDVNVRYGAGQGFSIKVDVSAMDGTKPDVARFRFPKADTQYTYYNPGNADGDKKTESVNSDDIMGEVRPGKLSDLTGTFQQMVGDTGNNQNPATATNYFLVGNPLICWLNMQKFFDINTQFERKYWIATANGQRTALFSETEGWVSTLEGDAQFLAPGVSFFVELKQNREDVAGQVPSAQISVTPQFTADMMSYEQGEKSPTTNNDGSNPNSRAAEQSYIPQLRLTAEDGNGRKSVAVLTDGTVAEHDMVETLFDSNLKDDIFLYTTKNGQAQSIANIVPGDTLPLVTAGLVDDVMLHIEGAEYFDCPLYIIDSEEGTIEPLTSDITLNCSTRGVRYYITSPGEKEEEMAISAPRVTAGSGRITIYAPANAAIEWAEIHSTNGTLVEKKNDIDYSYSAILPSAIYLVRLSVEGHVYTYKLLLTDK